ncbi:hypothetical protein EVA_13643 [gut metagenome]|uniref:Uncharacterized protein n=1 Tax=gut metagenome TaxID=749906 RepID=J9CE42_9ZZZZ
MVDCNIVCSDALLEVVELQVGAAPVPIDILCMQGRGHN